MSTELGVDVEYDEIVAGHTKLINGEKVVYIDRGKGKNKLLIGLATLMNKGVYAGVKSYSRDYPGDVLCLIDPDNSYYLRNDRGTHIRSVIREVVKEYRPENVVFWYALHKPHLPHALDMESGIRVGDMLRLSSHPK